MLENVCFVQIELLVYLFQLPLSLGLSGIVVSMQHRHLVHISGPGTISHTLALKLIGQRSHDQQ